MKTFIFLKEGIKALNIPRVKKKDKENIARRVSVLRERDVNFPIHEKSYLNGTQIILRKGVKCGGSNLFSSFSVNRNLRNGMPIYLLTSRPRLQDRRRARIGTYSHDPLTSRDGSGDIPYVNYFVRPVKIL